MYYNSSHTKNVKNLEYVLKYCSTNIHGPVKYFAQSSHLPQRALNHKSLLQTNKGSSIIAAALCAADVCIDWKTKCLISSGLSRCFTQENKNICNDRGLCRMSLVIVCRSAVGAENRTVSLSSEK